MPNGSAVFTDVQTVGSTGSVPNSADYTAAAAGNYQWQAVFTAGNAQNNGATSPCGTETFTVRPSAPTVTTTVGTGSGVFPSGTTPDGNSDASCAAFTGSLAINAKACDTVALNGAATPAAGTVTYHLYYAGAVGSTPNANSCSVGGVPNGTLLFTDVQTVASNGSVPNSTDFTVTNAGNYQWQVAFTSTNAQNLSSVSTCLSEPFTVAPNNPTFSTAQNLLPNDSANLTGATSTAGGSLTFDLYNPTNTTCSGTGDYHEVVTVSGNNIYKRGQEPRHDGATRTQHRYTITAFRTTRCDPLRSQRIAVQSCAGRGLCAAQPPFVQRLGDAEQLGLIDAAAFATVLRSRRLRPGHGGSQLHA